MRIDLFITRLNFKEYFYMPQFNFSTEMSNAISANHNAFYFFSVSRHR